MEVFRSFKVLTDQSRGRPHITSPATAGLLQGFPVNGSQSRRSFVVGEAGGRTQVVSLWAAMFTLLTLLFLGPLVAELPFAALAGIVIVAGAGLLAPAEFWALWHFRKTEIWPGIVTSPPSSF